MDIVKLNPLPTAIVKVRAQKTELLRHMRSAFFYIFYIRNVQTSYCQVHRKFKEIPTGRWRDQNILRSAAFLELRMYVHC